MAAGGRYDAVVVGAGHNGLVTAAYLAKAGFRTVVLERRDQVGGILAERRPAAGVRAPGIVHTVGRLRRSVIQDLGLAGHGLELLTPSVRAFAPDPDGPGVTLWSDPRRTADGLRSIAPKDAERYPAFDRRVRAIASFLAHLNASAPPEIQTPTMADAMAGLKLARLFRRLGPKAGREALRVLPMAVADLVGEAFDHDGLKGAIASRAVLYTAMGPWTAGTAAVLLNDSAGSDGGAAGQTVYARGGTQAVADALAAAARSFGAEMRLNADVTALTMHGDVATGVALATGEEITAGAVVSSADPKRTLLGLVDPEVLGPTMTWRVSNLRTPGATAKVNLVLSGVPSFAGTSGPDDERLLGRILIAQGIDHLERGADAGKYRRISAEPFLEATIPSLVDDTLAPQGQHVMSVVVQWAPYHLRDGGWETERDGLGDLVVKTLEGCAPGISNLVTARDVVTPVDLERDLGLTGGHVYHGEPGLDQFYAWRPLMGFARYRMPVRGLYLCGSGAHPGGGVTGAPGANAAHEILADLQR